MKAETLLSLPAGVASTDFFVTTGAFHLVLTSTNPWASCPVCQTPSAAQKSRYQRMVRDVPCGSHPLRILLQTRRFFCRQPTCAHRIFTERFPPFLLPRERMTEQLRAAWAKRGEPAHVVISGRNGRRVLHGALTAADLHPGKVPSGYASLSSG